MYRDGRILWATLASETVRLVEKLRMEELFQNKFGRNAAKPGQIEA